MAIHVEGSRSPSFSLSLSTPRPPPLSRSRSNRPETIPALGRRRLTRHTALRMTCGRWTNAIGSKGAPAFPPPYAPPSILVRLKRRFQSSRSGRAHAHAFAASTARHRWRRPGAGSAYASLAIEAWTASYPHPLSLPPLFLSSNATDVCPTS